NLAGVERPDGRVGFTPREIAQVKSHLMVDEHVIDDVRRRFDADPAIAEAWIRLRGGRHLEADLVLLEHELAQLDYLKTHTGATYREAHDHANERHNWQQDIPQLRRDPHGDTGGLREGTGGRPTGGIRLWLSGEGPPPGHREGLAGGPAAGRFDE